METTIDVADGTIDGYLAEPQPDVAGPGPWPGVVVVHDVFGLPRDTRLITERFATAGFVALAPDLYSRGGLVRCVRSVFRAMLAGEGRAFDDLEATRRTLADREDCNDRVGIVGFCLGGGFALVAAGGEFDASAPYYGQLPEDRSVLDGACPVVASFGGKDPTLKGAADELETALTARGIPHDVKEYPQARHSFANQLPLGPFNLVARISGFGYDHEASEDSWRRVLAFFSKQLR
ncbi:MULTISPECIES: dienelactone hydrolase family protein [Prauserella salsuginis group]|uniref:Dienelactone hydrolase family protein n=1 Tax=Prauserella salsuginis TaxID=387889 RepID=A0ABW6G0K7_9PSEU|nr:MULTISPECIES: dienelactone hydrolase family protein [Prauserella salsuginis group]MCR3721352.1 carboxymethylenebutenolidase [Prauserella flava]MCR3734568.1 carboxymethylenebutenolidase [Prauserella salsuginis]